MDEAELNVGGLRSRLLFLQHTNDLLFREPRSLHLSVLPMGRTLIKLGGKSGGHVWTPPAAPELLFSDEPRSGASMCSACSRSTVWLLALMKAAGWLPNHVIALEAL